MTFRDIGSFIDTIIPLALGVFFVLARRGKTPENEKQGKAIKIMRFCGWSILTISITMLIYKVSTK